jgi:hypothetical protein
MSLAEDLSEDRRRYPFISPDEQRNFQAELRLVAPSIVAETATSSVVDQIEDGLRNLVHSIADAGQPKPAAPIHPIAAAVERTRRPSTGTSARQPADRFAPRAVRPVRMDDEANDDMPTFLRHQPAETASSALRRPVERPSQHHPSLPRSLDPVTMALPVRPPSPSKRGAAAGSAISLILAYSVFLLIPLTAWVSDLVDPRIAAMAPTIYFLGWLSIHSWRRDQLAQLRILAAWQGFQLASALYAMKPGSSIHGGIFWNASVTAACASLFVVAVLAIVEAGEFRTVRNAQRSSQPPARPEARRPQAR